MTLHPNVISHWPWQDRWVCMTKTPGDYMHATRFQRDCHDYGQFAGNQEQPISLAIFSNLMKNLFYQNSIPSDHIATNVCTCHGSGAAVACAKICGNLCMKISTKTKYTLNQIWVMMIKIVSTMCRCCKYSVCGQGFSCLLCATCSVGDCGGWMGPRI